MAELVIKIGDGGGYFDDDILAAFSRRYIRLCHAEHICHPRINGKKVGGLLGDTQPLLEAMYWRMYQYMWERLNRNELKRTNLWTGSVAIYGSTPIEDPDKPGHMIHCHVDEYFARRLEAGKLPLFGTSGREIQYGGRSKRDAATVELIWDAIESRTALKRVDHDDVPVSQEQQAAMITLALSAEQQRSLRERKVPEPWDIKYFGGDRQYHTGRLGDQVLAIRGGADARDHLFFKVDDFDDAMAVELVAPLTKTVPVTETNPAGIKVVRKRKHYIDWRADIASSVSAKASVADIEDRTKYVDVRRAKTFSRVDIVRTHAVAKVGR